MLEVLHVTGPIFLLIGVGWLVVRTGLFEPAHMRVVGRVVLMLCMPALLFDALAKRRLGEVIVEGYVIAYALGSLTTMALGFAWARWGRGASASMAGVQAMGWSCPNSGFVGYPVMQQLMGAQAGSVLALNMLVENLLLLPLAMAMSDAGEHGRARRALVQAGKAAARNPLVIAIVAGATASLIGWAPPAPVARTVQLLAGAATPLALIVVGGSLVSLNLKGAGSDVARVAFGKLIVHPLVVAAFLLVVPDMPMPMKVALITTAALPMLSIYPVLSQKHGHERFAAATLLLATTLSFVTLSAGLWWVRQHPAWLP